MTPQRFRLHNVGSMLGTFGVANLQADPNCVLAQLPDYGVWGVQDFLPRRNLLLATDTLATQTVAVVATAYKLYMQGTGSITLSGTATGTLNGTGANDRVSLSFTPTAGTLTLTVSGTVTFGMLCRADTIDQSYQAVTDWTTEQYAWAAQKQVPWLRRNLLLATEDFTSASWIAAGASPSISKSKTVTDPYGVVNNAWRLTISGGSATRGIAQTTASGITTYATGVSASVRVWLKVPSGTLTTYIMAVTNSLIGRLQCDLATDWQEFILNNQSVGGRIASFLLSGGIPDGAEIDIFQPSVNIGSTVVPYQPIGASWDATYTALAAAAGFNAGIWQDAGTNPVNTSGQSVYRIADASGKGYTANQATAANRPLWTLDANGKPYLLGDQVNDAMPVTFPASFSSNASVYVTTDAGTTVTDGVTLNGSYAPLVEEKQYARVVFKSGRPTYHEKLIRWLNAKAGL